MLPVSKNSVLQLLFGISYTGAIGFHKLMGWFFVIVSVIHVGVYMKAASMDSMQSLESHMFNTYDPNFAAMMPGYTMKEWGKIRLYVGYHFYHIVNHVTRLELIFI
jgi:Ferric reductase like transmembrane component